MQMKTCTPGVISIDFVKPLDLNRFGKYSCVKNKCSAGVHLECMLLLHNVIYYNDPKIKTWS